MTNSDPVRWGAGVEYPDQQRQLLHKAKRLQWLTIGYLVTTIIAIYLTMGQSQAMKTAWAEDLLSLIPPLVFLISIRLAAREPDRRFPYGYHRAVMIGYLVAALALVVVGGFLLIDAAIKLITMEHPTINSIDIFGTHVWLGWLMFPALLWGAVPPVFIGRAKLPLASMLQDKILYADAKMNKADWLTAVGAIAGVAGIGLGIWWADAAAAALISLDILNDGLTNLGRSVRALMDESPRRAGERELDPLLRRLVSELEAMPEVKAVRVRLREEGHVYFGDVAVVLASEREVLDKLTRIAERAHALDWRIHDIVVAPARSLD
ncbi:MAG: cation diffusion facilitator family transporter [Gammaproteobacteria bacterium]